MERSIYRDSKTTLGVSWDAQLGSVEELQGMLVSRWWLASLPDLIFLTQDLGAVIVASVRIMRAVLEPC